MSCDWIIVKYEDGKPSRLCKICYDFEIINLPCYPDEINKGNRIFEDKHSKCRSTLNIPKRRFIKKLDSMLGTEMTQEQMDSFEEFVRKKLDDIFKLNEKNIKISDQ